MHCIRISIEMSKITIQKIKFSIKDFLNCGFGHIYWRHPQWKLYSEWKLASLNLNFAQKTNNTIISSMQSFVFKGILKTATVYDLENIPTSSSNLLVEFFSFSNIISIFPISPIFLAFSFSNWNCIWNFSLPDVFCTEKQGTHIRATTFMRR